MNPTPVLAMMRVMVDVDRRTIELDRERYATEAQYLRAALNDVWQAAHGPGASLEAVKAELLLTAAEWLERA